MQISGFGLDVCQREVFSLFSRLTRERWNDLVERLSTRISEFSDVVFISLGENCGPSLKIKECKRDQLGSFLFDNIVSDIAATRQMIEDRFSNLLQLSNLGISTWEGHDSVIDHYYECLFHHYFFPRGEEKRRGGITRRIDADDIPLFYPLVKYQFEYLVLKFISVARSSLHKVYVIRQVDGKEISDDSLSRLYQALLRLGAQNFQLFVVVSCRNASCKTPGVVLSYIPENFARWGDASDWEAMFQKGYPVMKV